MSVREKIYLSAQQSVPEVVADIAAVLDIRSDLDDGFSGIVVPTELLVPGYEGMFGGPVEKNDDHRLHRPPGEWEATDAYDIEFSMWQAYGPNVDEATGADVQLAAARAMFHRLTALRLPMIHVHETEGLFAAYRPELGTKTYPEGTSVYDWDAETWGEWVLPSPSAVREQAEAPDTAEQA